MKKKKYVKSTHSVALHERFDEKTEVKIL